MKGNQLISVIVPVYNVEKYLRRCVNSILNQTYKNLQIILVDDKSNDNSGKICDELCKEDSRIEVIHKDVNEGLGYARNTGMNYVEGEYLMFVDSDDYLDLQLCEKALQRIIETEADACYFCDKRDINGKIIDKTSSFLKDEYSGKELLGEFLENTIAQPITRSGTPNIGMSAWRILYKSAPILNNGIIFCSEREYLNEDLFFRVSVASVYNKIAVLREGLYYYCFNGASLTTSYRADRFEASKRMYDRLVEVTSFCDSEEIKLRCKRAFMNNLMVCFRQEILSSNRSRCEANQNMRRYCNDSVVRHVLSTYPIERMPIQPRLFYLSIMDGNVLFIRMLVKFKGLIK